MQIGILGCGFVADLYMRTLAWHPQLEIAGVVDRDGARATSFAKHYSVRNYNSLDNMLSDVDAKIVLNLTNPASHYDVSRKCLDAGKHVYSEKPLAMDLSDAAALVEMAEQNGLRIAAAPCSILSESAQTLWKALREERIGQVRLVYSEVDDGMVHQAPYRKWFSVSGIPWPYKNEFETGCTLEHAGYAVTWLTAFFGPAKSVTSVAACLIPDKQTDVPLDVQSPDFTVACIKFASGTVARLTCSIISPLDHSLRIVGDDGILSVRDTWHYNSPVYLQRWLTIRRRQLVSPWKKKLRTVGKGGRVSRFGAAQMDFLRGVAELAGAIREQRPCRLSPDFCLHTTEIVLAIQHAPPTGSYELTTTFDPIEPMPWAHP